MKQQYIFHGIIEKVDDLYCALRLELGIATEPDTLEGAKKNEIVHARVSQAVE